jgi:hypothetical protein
MGGGEKTNAYRILVRRPEGERSLEDLDIGGRIIIRWILEREVGCDTDQWRELLNTVMNLRVS